MADTKNALAELAVELQVVRDVANRGCTNETAVGRVVGKAQRIVEELAKANDAIFYADEFAKDGFKDCIYIPATQQLCVKKILKCRAIAEEGGADGNR